MATLGLVNTLTIQRLGPEGALLDASPEGEVLLPLAQVPKGSAVGQSLEVFLYMDGEGRLIASLQPPVAQRGEVACLKVVAVNMAGAFLAWGLPKDLLLPWKEVKHPQRQRIKVGQKVMVVLFTDEVGRMAASARLDDFLRDEAEGFREGDRVALVIGERTELGVRVVVNHQYWGMVHDGDIFGEVTRGEVRDGYIKALREDRKLTISLAAPGYAKIDAIAQGVLDTLKRRGGFLPITDKSSPEQISALFGISKKVFKQTLGALYKSRRILLGTDGIRLAP